MNTTQALEFYYKRLADLYRNQCIDALLSWDQQVNLPPLGASARADQIEHMSLAHHAMATDPEFIRVVEELFENLDGISDDDRVSVRLTKRQLDRERKLPEDFLAEVAQVTSLSFNAWVAARPANDFAAVRPYLEKIVDLEKRRSDLLGYDASPYDPLLDIYDPGATTSVVKPVLSDLGDQLQSILPEIVERSAGQPGLRGHFDQSAQHRLCRKVAEDLGFSFESGRLDIAPHPFMTTLGPADHRITTRYSNDSFIGSLYGVIHETGHALYEMGMPPDYGKHPPLGSPISLSIHESQSRLWENHIGRSREFSAYLSRIIGEFFPDQAEQLTADQLWRYANHVEPSLIRTEADEVTYSLHVVIRMLLEEQLIMGTLAVADLPDAWGDLYEEYLGIRPPDYKDGVMQDMHWYTGSFGYFPTYALGNLYNSMMMESARQAIPDLPAQIERGEFSPMLGWLRENVHRHGLRYFAPELIVNITGKQLSAKPFVDYLRRKFLA